ncbi:MAG: sulfotransferase, partial [Gemmatimonadetes bacterium]|nr:sulfotransferase [Gemmatimonadota bacterium]
SKDPGFYRELETLATLYPAEAKYLCVVRDGRDVALSMMEQPWGQTSWYANARLWVETYRRITTFRETLDPRRYWEFRYEDLLRDPETVATELSVFLERPLEPGRIERLVEDISDGPWRRNYDKWKTRMSDKDRRIYEAVAGGWLDRFGYERTLEGARVRAWEPIVYETQELVRRAVRKTRLALGEPSANPTGKRR